MTYRIFFILPFWMIYFSVPAQLPEGEWHASLQINDTLHLPFTFTTMDGQLVIHNAEENIEVDELKFEDDSVFIQMPVFDSQFRCRLQEEKLTGIFYNYSRKDKNQFYFFAERGLSYRFSDKPGRTSVEVSGRYHVVFDGEDQESRNAVAVLKQVGNHLAGTFLTTTGDYRYLEGELNGNRLWLSAFDGSHLFLFTAIAKDDSLIAGEFFSGKHWHDTWIAWRDDQAKLPSPDTFTYLKEGYKKFDFSFPDEDGKMVSLSDTAYRDKPAIVQVMGTWCPNCMDETRFLSEWNNSGENPGVVIIALDYERIPDPKKAKQNIERLKERFDITYPVLFAGSSNKEEAARTLPMMNRVFAFPTTIFLDRRKNVIKIYTGFNGPATGNDFEIFKTEFANVVRRLMQ